MAEISYRLWEQHFSLSQDVIGKMIELDGKAHCIVGVLPASFVFPDSNDLSLREVVGLAGNVRAQNPLVGEAPQVYVPLAQSPITDLLLMLQTNVPPLSLTGEVTRLGARRRSRFGLFTMSPPWSSVSPTRFRHRART